MKTISIKINKGEHWKQIYQFDNEEDAFNFLGGNEGTYYIKKVEDEKTNNQPKGAL